jgi:hypothetical protein
MTLISLRGGKTVIVAEHVVAVEEHSEGWVLHTSGGKHLQFVGADYGSMADFLAKLGAVGTPKLPTRKAKS